MSRYSHINKKPLETGDKVLVKATIVSIGDDPHDPTVVVWFNGAAHETTVMNVERDTSGQPITRSSWGDTQPVNPFETQTWNPNDAADIVVDVRPDLESVEDLLDKVETPTDEPPARGVRRTGRSAPPNQSTVFDGRRRLFAVSDDPDDVA